MRVTLNLELEDRPGQLVQALGPVAKFGGNIVSVIHLREEKTPRGLVPVEVVFEADEKTVEEIVGELEKKEIAIRQIGEVKKKEKVTTIIIGHVVDTDIRDTIDRLNEIPGVLVADLDLAMPHPEKESSTRMTIEASSKEAARKALKKLYEVAEEKEFVVIRSLEGEM